MYSRYAKLRDERGLTDYAVASRAGIKESTFYDWRQRSAKDPKAAISALNLKKIADLFDVPMEFFLTDTAEATK